MALCKRVLVGIAFFLASAGLILTVSGLASLQHLCYTDDVAATNSRKLLAVDRTPVTEALFASCQKTMRFQWWGWALELVYVVILAAATSVNADTTGVHMVGVTSTVLNMIFANDTLKAVDDADSVMYSRTTVTFVGFIVMALANYCFFLSHGSCSAGACSGQSSARVPGAKRENEAPEIVATTA